MKQDARVGSENDRTERSIGKLRVDSVSPEVQEVYDRLRIRGEKGGEISKRLHTQYGNEMALVQRSRDKRFCFIGGTHTRDAGHPYIKYFWLTLRSAPPGPRTLFVAEGGLRTLNPTWNEADVVALGPGEQGVLRRVADELGASYTSFEPSDDERIAKTLIAGFNKESVADYFIARYAYWLHRTMKQPPTHTELMRHYEECLTSSFTVQEIEDAIQRVLLAAATEAEDHALHNIASPYKNPVSEKVGEIRDMYTLEGLKRAIDAGYNVWSVYGSGHIITLRDVMTELFDTPGMEVVDLTAN